MNFMNKSYVLTLKFPVFFFFCFSSLNKTKLVTLGMEGVILGSEEYNL